MELLSPDLGLFFWILVAFTIVLFLLKKFAWKPILGALEEREHSIADSIASAEKIKLEMATLKNENENALAQAREERSLMLKEAKEAKDKIISDAKVQAAEAANKIMEDARLQINNEKMAALTEVKNQVGSLVLDLSTKVLRKELSDKATQESYINTLVSEVKLN